MFDGESFLKAGWIHGLKLHQFSKGDISQFLILGKVANCYFVQCTMLH